MKVSMCKTMRTYEWKNLSKDLLAGLVIMAVSIPISMGYAQIAGLPAVYGLYGSVFPILLFALFSTSPQFIFGVDAAPAALVGSALVSLGIEGGCDGSTCGSSDADLFCGSVAAGLLSVPGRKLVNYISAPVMGGFISGICTTIILMQVPKLLGGKAGVGRRNSGTGGAYLGKSDDLSSAILLLGVGALVDASGIKKAGFQISDGSGADGSGSNWYGGISIGRSGYSDTRGSETGTSDMESSGFWSSSVKRSSDHQSFGGSCHHGRNIAGGEQLCTEKPLPDQ